MFGWLNKVIATAIIYIAFAETGWSFLSYTITPARIDKALFSIEEITEVFEVQNLSNDTLRIRLIFESFEIDEDGKTIFLSPEKIKNSIAHHSIVNPEEFLIPPQSREFVRLTFRMPDDTIPEYYGMLIFKSQPIPSTYQPMIQVVGEIGIPIYYYKTHLALKDAEIEDLNVADDSVYAHVKNKGNIHLRMFGELLIMTLDEKIIARDSISEFVVFPGKTRRLKVPLKEVLLDGEYLLRIRLDYGGMKIIEGERRLKIKKF
ncbi:MAG: hypothetical protein N3A65_06670 [candidate division WOR-3 bacterium]|nr:hypothetical protein [candidate division WOR-3 bacterium]